MHSQKLQEPDGAISLSHRQRQLLTLLDAIGGTATNTDLQKLVFLYCREPSIDAIYEFVPYKFGAFSFTLLADKRKLIEKGILVNNDTRWSLSPRGRGYIGERDLYVTAFASRMVGIRGDALIAETYRQYPYYATRSEVATRVLEGDKQALERIREASEIRVVRSVFTIGYEERSLENYLNILIGAGVTLLCDVRRNPLSRKYGFSKTTLANACQGVGIAYEHLPEFGIASEQRQGLDTQADYDALFAEYERKHLPDQRNSLDKIVDWVKSGKRVALTCYERLPQQCHRHCVSDAIASAFGKGFTAKHL